MIEPIMPVTGTRLSLRRKCAVETDAALFAYVLSDTLAAQRRRARKKDHMYLRFVITVISDH